MSDLPEASENFAEGTLSNLDTAKKALDEGLYDVAFVRSFWCCENLLKAILVKEEKFDTGKGGDKHHNCWRLYQKIKGLNIIDENKISTIEHVLVDLVTINISSGSSHINSSHDGRSKVGDLRYDDLNKYVDLNDVREKVELANQLVSLLTGYF